MLNNYAVMLQREAMQDTRSLRKGLKQLCRMSYLKGESRGNEKRIEMYCAMR